MQTPRDAQTSFFELATQRRGATNRVLETIAQVVDFTEAEEKVRSTYSQRGRPGSRVGMLLRVMILQHLYGLSDPQAEEQLRDRLSFQEFVQLSPEEDVPDETTICRFRQRLIECGLHEQLLELFNRQLEARGYIVKKTTLVDATIIESSRSRPPAQLAQSGKAGDADARYTRKRAKTYYGYKAHISSDGEHQLVRTAVMTAANVSEDKLLPEVTPLEAGSVYADKAYDTKANAEWLKDQGIENQIAKKGAHHIKLSDEDREANRRKSRVRSGIERIFAHWKQWHDYRRARYVGLARNQLELTLKAVAYNLKRVVGILSARGT